MKATKAELEQMFSMDTEFVTSKGLAALGVFLADLAHYVAWETGRAYSGHVLNIEANGCRLVLKARKGGRAEVTFIEGQTTLDVYRQLWVGLHKDLLRWYPDKYVSK